MSPAFWAGITATLLVIALYAAKPKLLRLAERIRERRERHG